MWQSDCRACQVEWLPVGNEEKACDPAEIVPGISVLTVLIAAANNKPFLSTAACNSRPKLLTLHKSLAAPRLLPMMDKEVVDLAAADYIDIKAEYDCNWTMGLIDTVVTLYWL